MIIGMVMTSRKIKQRQQIQPQQIQQQQIQQQPIQQQPSSHRIVHPTSQPPYVNHSSMNRINLHSMRLGSNYSMNSLYNSPYRSGG